MYTLFIYIYIYGNCDLIPFGIIDPTPGGNRGAKDFGKNASNQVGAEASPQPKGCREAAPQAERVCGGARKPKCRVVHLKLLRLVRMCENWCFFTLLDRRPAAGIVHSSKNVCFASRKHDFPSRVADALFSGTLTYLSVQVWKIIQEASRNLSLSS